MGVLGAGGRAAGQGVLSSLWNLRPRWMFDHGSDERKKKPDQRSLFSLYLYTGGRCVVSDFNPVRSELVATAKNKNTQKAAAVSHLVVEDPLSLQVSNGSLEIFRSGYLPGELYGSVPLKRANPVSGSL